LPAASPRSPSDLSRTSLPALAARNICTSCPVILRTEGSYFRSTDQTNRSVTSWMKRSSSKVSPQVTVREASMEPRDVAWFCGVAYGSASTARVTAGLACVLSCRSPRLPQPRPSATKEVTASATVSPLIFAPTLPLLIGPGFYLARPLLMLSRPMPATSNTAKPPRA